MVLKEMVHLYFVYKTGIIVKVKGGLANMPNVSKFLFLILAILPIGDSCRIYAQQNSHDIKILWQKNKTRKLSYESLLRKLQVDGRIAKRILNGGSCSIKKTADILDWNSKLKN